ncbi:MAG: hypothetical protein EA427_08045 [Spirochaetaceae bacterium]|nr:MAG: hypothetical protein EA427_08045 [Spirochaetaceae bacterium]
MSISKGAEKLNRYLKSARMAASGTDPVICVVGNEAADLDSMASAVVYAYHRATRGASALPLINIPREDFKLRTEAVYLFEKAGVDLQALIFADEIDLGALKSAGRLSLVLVDHNRPAKSHATFTDVVTGVIDHHADEGLFQDAAVRVIEPVGSAATLVAREMLGGDVSELDEGIATLLLGTILLDTVGLDPDAGRVTPGDQEIADRLLALTGADQKQLFDALQREKFNVSALDSSDLLRKDYKEWQMGDLRVGVSSVLLSISDWLDKDAALSRSLGTYAAARKLDLLLAMNAYTSPSFTRELVVYCPDESVRNRVIPFLEGGDLGLTPISSGAIDSDTRLYAQGNAGISRKKLQPILSDFLGK